MTTNIINNQRYLICSSETNTELRQKKIGSVANGEDHNEFRTILTACIGQSVSVARDRMRATTYRAES